MMRRFPKACFGVFAFCASAAIFAAPNAIANDAPSAETLINSPLEAIGSHHALVTRVTIPANLSLPPHAHPSEEFLYVISGETTLAVEGEDAQVISAGMAAKIPARALHVASTGAMTAEVIVFRVHPNGQPIRIEGKNTNGSNE